MLVYADGAVEVVEIKSKFTRRAQRDYIYRRRLFIDLIAEPKGYKFTEIITADSKDEIREWKRLAKQAGRSEKAVTDEEKARFETNAVFLCREISKETGQIAVYELGCAGRWSHDLLPAHSAAVQPGTAVFCGRRKILHGTQARNHCQLEKAAGC